MILDTCFLIDLMNQREQAISKLIELEERNEAQKISTISIVELFQGSVRCNNTKKEKEKILFVYQNLLLQTLDEKSAQKSGEIFGEMINKGTPIELADAIIAGTAIVHNEKVLTRNTKHFSRIEGLKIETY